VGMFFTRIGCLLNGGCSGKPVTGWLGLKLPNQRGVWQRRIPTQALESAWAAVLLVGAIAFRKSMPFPGALFLFVSLGYGMGRIAMEFARERERKSTFSFAHVISVIITLLSVTTLTTYWKQ